MNSENEKELKEIKVSEKPADNFNELSGIYMSTSIKIFDPNTEEVLVHKRGDN